MKDTRGSCFLLEESINSCASMESCASCTRAPEADCPLQQPVGNVMQQEMQTSLPQPEISVQPRL